MQLLIANKNYSSWSLRAWLLLRQAGIPFDELALRFGDSRFRDKVRAHSGAGRVPVLIADDGFVVWDSLAIAEYAAERFPEHRVWPDDANARARARSVCAEMHSGFTVIRNTIPMNCEAHFKLSPVPNDLRREIERVVEIWESCRREFGEAGEFLFGRFSAADAFFAPVAIRFDRHGIELPAVAARYADALLELPSLREWIEAGLAEHEFVEMDEPYRTAR